MSKTIDFRDLPKDPFALKGMLFTVDIEDRVSASLKFISDEYQARDRLYECREYMDFVYTESFKGNFREWDKHGGFPAIETQLQFDQAIKQALIGCYKPAFDHLRSCIELTLLTVYFSFDEHYMDSEDWLNQPDFDWKKAKEKERQWFDSIIDTPFFSKMLKVVLKDWRFAAFESQYQWSVTLKALYYILSDYTHIRGYKMGTQTLSRPNAFVNSSSFQNINLKTLEEFLDILIQVTEQLVILITLYNPITLMELPLEDKFGMNEPIGFIHPGQAEMVNTLIPAAYRSYFDDMKINDEEIKSLVEWVMSQPDMTTEQIQRQMEDFQQRLQKDKSAK